MAVSLIMLFIIHYDIPVLPLVWTLFTKNENHIVYLYIKYVYIHHYWYKGPWNGHLFINDGFVVWSTSSHIILIYFNGTLNFIDIPNLTSLVSASRLYTITICVLCLICYWFLQCWYTKHVRWFEVKGFTMHTQLCKNILK